MQQRPIQGHSECIGLHMNDKECPTEANSDA